MPNKAEEAQKSPITSATKKSPSLPAVPEAVLKNRALVHRILLTDPNRLQTLTLSGKPRSLQTPTFKDFCASLDTRTRNIGQPSSSSPETVELSIEHVVKGAFRDQLVERICQDESLVPACDLLLELHGMLRSLVPSRNDLHKLLDDEAVIAIKEAESTSVTGISSLIIHAAKALEALESEARAESTQDWIQVADSKKESSIFQVASISFLVSSIMYLLYKAELCQEDKHNFYFTHLWAPKILQKGPELERANFEAEFGLLLPSSPSSTPPAPSTRAWIRMLINKASQKTKDSLLQSTEQRRNLVRVGWVETLLFYSATSSVTQCNLLLPEVFALDQGRIQMIRRITKLASTGSALALHASQAAGQPSSVLNRLDPPSSPIDLRRVALVQAISEQWKTQDAYEQDVSTAVISLAEEWDRSLSFSSSSLNAEAKEALSGQTRAVLEARDPVLQLLVERMKDCFKQVVLMLAESTTAKASAIVTPTEMRTGRASDSTKTPKSTAPANLQYERIRDVFCDRGLSFYALELATGAQMAFKIIELALDAFGHTLLDRLIVEECSS